LLAAGVRHARVGGVLEVEARAATGCGSSASSLRAPRGLSGWTGLHAGALLRAVRVERSVPSEGGLRRRDPRLHLARRLGLGVRAQRGLLSGELVSPGTVSATDCGDAVSLGLTGGVSH